MKRADGAGRVALVVAAAALTATLPACTGEVEPERVTPAVLEGFWRAELLLLGESLPFRLELSPGELVAGQATGAGARVAITEIELRARAWVLVLGEAGTELVGRLSPDGDKLEGFWRPRGGREGPEVPFVAVRAPDSSLEETRMPQVGREWSGTLQLATTTAVGSVELRRFGADARGRVQLPGGSTLDVVGRLEQEALVLRGFDGRRAVLLQGRERGPRIDGQVWTGAGATGTWSAVPAGR